MLFLCHLEDVGEVSQVEDVVELDSGGEEGGGDALVQGQGQLDQGGAALLQGSAEALSFQVLRQDGGVDGAQGLGSRKRQGKDREVALWMQMNETAVNMLFLTNDADGRLLD